MRRKRPCSEQTRAVLGCLAEGPRPWCHGYELARATGLKSGTLYPILIRLSDRGLLESKWQPSESSGKPPRHLYRLTARGAEFAEREFADRPQRGLAARASRA